MPIDFPASPSLNQTYSYDGKTWIWNGSGWAAYGTIVSATAPIVYSSGAFSLSGTTAQFNTALTDGDFATLAGSEVLTGKTISGANNTLSNIGNSSLTNSAITVNGTAISLGSSGTITAANPNALTIGTGLSGTSYSGSSAVTIAIDSTVATLTGTQVFTNKSLSDSTTYIVDNADNTKRLQFDITGTTGITGIFQTAFTTAKTVVFQDVAGTVYVSGGTDVSLADGGTGASLTASNGGIVYSTGSAMAILTGTATAGQILRSGASGAPSWSTATYPSTTTANQILYSSAANTISGITTANNQVLVTNASGVPAFSGTLPSGVTASSLTSFGTSPTLTTPTIDTINVSGASVAAVLWNTTLTTGSISMGGALTSGGVTIAGGTTFAGTIAIANASTSAHTVNISNGAGTTNKTINIGTASTGGTTAITIGSSSGATSNINLNGGTAGIVTISTGTVFVAPLVTNAQTASYTLVLADAGKLVEINNAAANNLTVPLNSSVAYPVGTQINILQTGAGQTTIVATGGVTINGTPGLKLRAQWSSATLIKRATDTWVLVGDLTA